MPHLLLLSIRCPAPPAGAVDLKSDPGLIHRDTTWFNTFKNHFPFMAFTPIGEFISLKQAISQYDYSQRSFYRLREKGLLQFHKVGKRTFIRRSEFEALIQPQLV